MNSLREIAERLCRVADIAIQSVNDTSRPAPLEQSDLFVVNLHPGDLILIAGHSTYWDYMFANRKLFVKKRVNVSPPFLFT